MQNESGLPLERIPVFNYLTLALCLFNSAYFNLEDAGEESFGPDSSAIWKQLLGVRWCADRKMSYIFLSMEQLLYFALKPEVKSVQNDNKHV